MPSPHQSLSFLSSVSILLLLPLLANSHSCSEGFFIEASRRNITQHCKRKVLALGIEFAWNFDNNSQRLDIAFGAKLGSEPAWLAWGLNPDGPRMVGTRALIGIKLRHDSLQCHMYNITDATKRRCQLILPSQGIGLDVRNFSFVPFGEIGYHVIVATVFLSKEYNGSSANFVWQIGTKVLDGVPMMHPISLSNLDSAETINLISGEVTSFKPHERLHLRTAHGTLNIIGWGILLPIGVMAARYFRSYPKRWPWWFVLHVGCQIVGFTLGSIGWIIGIWLGYKSKYYSFRTHRIIGIIIFTFTTIQMMALRLKPKSSDEYRTYWNMYHHFLGYALLAVISVNIFEGIKIFESRHHLWRWSYIGVLGVLGTVALAFEIFTCIKFLKSAIDQRAEKASANNPNLSQVSDAQASAGSAVRPQSEN